MIKTIIFDFDDTLYTAKDNWKDIDIYWKSVIRALVGKKEEENFFKRHKFKSPIHSNDVIGFVRSEGYDMNKFAEIVENNFYDRGDMKVETMPNEFFEELKKKYSLYIVSMGRRKYLDYYIKKYGIKESCFKKVISVYSDNHFTIDTKTPIYQKIMEEEKIKSKEILVVGNGYSNDIKPAEELKMQTLLFKGDFNQIFSYFTKNKILDCKKYMRS